MEILTMTTLVVATLITAFSCFVESTRRTIILLSIQAISISSATLVHCLINLIIGLNVKALIHFFVAFAEFFSAAVIVPLILYWGVVKTEDNVDKPIIGVRRLTILVISTIALYVTLLIFYSQALQEKVIAFSFSMLMFSLSIFLMTTRRDSLKILAGLNMAENSLYPLLAEVPIILVPLILVLMIFVTAMGTYIIIEAYIDHGTILVDRWRWLSE